MADLLSRRPAWLKHFEPSLTKWSSRWHDAGVQCGEAHPVQVSNATTTSKLSALHVCYGIKPVVPVFNNSVAELVPQDLVDAILASQEKHIPPSAPFEVDSLGLLRTVAGQVIIPRSDEELARRVVAELHSAFHHLGRHKTQARVKRLFYIHQLQRICSEVCNSCQICQQVKVPRKPPPGTVKPLNTEDAQTGPMHTINLDFVWGLPGVQGKTGFLTVIDGFSMYLLTHSRPSVLQMMLLHA